MTTVDENMNVAITKDVNVANETSKANAQADTVNAKKDVANEVLGSALKNIVPGWVKDLITNPIVPAVAVGLLTASPIAALGTFGVGTLSKTLAKINENTSGKATYKDATISDKSIVLNKDGTWAYTGENTVKTSSTLPCNTTSCFGPGKRSMALEKGGTLAESAGPAAREPQAPPSVDEKKKEEPKKEEPKKAEPKKEEPKAEPKKEEPKKEESKKEEPKAEPKKEEPKKEESKKEEPKAEPKKEEPKAEVVAETTVTIPQPMGAVEPKVPENQPTVEIPAPMNNGPSETAQPSSGDVAVVKPRVIHVGESDKDVDKEVQGNEGKSEKTHESDSSVGIWEGRDDIDKNDTKNNSGGDYSSNSDNKSISPEYQALLDSLDSTPDVSDGPDF